MKLLSSLSATVLVCTLCVSHPAYAKDVQAKVDADASAVEMATKNAGLSIVTQIDHARLAAKEGVEMPPARVQVFSDVAVNTPLLAENIRAGLDLPFRVLSFSQSGTPTVMYTSADFLRQRHGLTDAAALNAFDKSIALVADAVDAVPAPVDGLSLNYGITELRTSLDVETAVARLTEAVMAQDDTIWFAEIDFSAEAATQGVVLPEAELLLFGGPGPGGIAMKDFPSIGLDAFCQKLMVYAVPSGGSMVIFNDIAALSELHYGASAKPHYALNERLTATFQGALR